MKRLFLILAGAAVVGLLLFSSAFLVPTEAPSTKDGPYTNRPLIEVYEPPKVNEKKDVPFCDGTKAAYWHEGDLLKTITDADPGWGGYFRHEAETRSRRFARCG